LGSPHLDEELGRIAGQLAQLAPALEHMETRERETVAKIATILAHHEGLRREFDQLVQKLSARLKDLYNRVGTISSQAATHVGLTDLKVLFDRVGALETQALDFKRILKHIEDSHKNVWKKVWDVSKILITIILTALATKYFGGGGK